MKNIINSAFIGVYCFLNYFSNLAALPPGVYHQPLSGPTPYKQPTHFSLNQSKSTLQRGVSSTRSLGQNPYITSSQFISSQISTSSLSGPFYKNLSGQSPYSNGLSSSQISGCNPR